MTSPARIVSLVPSWTETVVELGARERLVGATRYCVEPDDLGPIARVGGTKNPDLEAIAALRPDLVLVNGEENRPADIAWLGARFPLLEATPRSVPEAAAVVRALGHRLGAGEAASALLLAIEAQVARAQVVALGHGAVRVFYAIWPRPWMGVNQDTYVHDVLVRAGAVNVLAERAPRYPELAAAELARLDADLVLLPDEPFAFGERERQDLLESGALGRDVPVLLVSGKDYCWHGARTGPGLGRALELLLPFRARR